MKVILTSIANLGTFPAAIYLPNGRPYGHAVYDATQNRHVLEMPYEDWLKVGPDVVRMGTNPLNQWFATFKPEEDGEDVEGLKAHIEELEDQLKEAVRVIGVLRAQKDERDQTQGNLSNLSSANPDAAAPAAPAHTLDGQVEAMRLARDLPRTSDDSIEQKDDGTLEKVHRELHPVQAGSPVEDLAADGQTGKTTTRVPVEGTHLEIIEEREKIEPPKEESTLKANVEAALGSKDVPNQDAAEVATAQAVAEGAGPTGGAAEGLAPAPATSTAPAGDDLDDITNFRTLRKKAQDEGVSDVDLAEIKTVPDLRAMIRLHREQQAQPKSGK